MTEEEAKAWLIKDCSVSRETYDRLDAFAHAVIEENARQNLISEATVAHIWQRHIVDSAQLWALRDEPLVRNPWLDLGTGAGFPGMIIAILSKAPIILVEGRRKRFDFLLKQVQHLGLAHATVHCGKLESLKTREASVISARAFAPLPKLFGLAHRFSTGKTLWLLPKGRSAREELESAQTSWQGVFHVEPSITDAEGAILVARGVRPGKKIR